MSVQGGVCFASSNFDEICRAATTTTPTTTATREQAEV